MQSTLFKSILECVKTHESDLSFSILKWIFISLTKYSKFFFKYILLKFKVHYKCTFNTKSTALFHKASKHYLWTIYQKPLNNTRSWNLLSHRKHGWQKKPNNCCFPILQRSSVLSTWKVWSRCGPTSSCLLESDIPAMISIHSEYHFHLGQAALALNPGGTSHLYAYAYTHTTLTDCKSWPNPQIKAIGKCCNLLFHFS